VRRVRQLGQQAVQRSRIAMDRIVELGLPG
jgi:hypothetical protein